MRVGTDDVEPSSFVRNLGIYIDADVSMRTHIAKTVSGCFAVLRQLRSIRRSVTQPIMQSLVVALVLTRLDYGNATLAGLSGEMLKKTTVGAPCGRSIDLRGAKIRPRDTVATRLALASVPTTN